ncbi:MAG TPA: hypothetical protein EYQ53_01885 [Candidatus Poseidoniales archaeon]|nr:hypothetical protein [Candidatus Poseidoniales archaeon]
MKSIPVIFAGNTSTVVALAMLELLIVEFTIELKPRIKVIVGVDPPELATFPSASSAGGMKGSMLEQSINMTSKMA